MQSLSKRQQMKEVEAREQKFDRSVRKHTTTPRHVKLKLPIRSPTTPEPASALTPYDEGGRREGSLL